jgi:hypothetical protein
VYQIFFVDGILFPESSALPQRFVMAEEGSGERLNELVEIIFYELPKMDEQVRKYQGRERKTLREDEKWCIYMKHQGEAEARGMIEALTEEEEGIMKAEMALRKVSRDQEMWARALFREKAEMDYRSEMSASRSQGITEGITIGKAEAKDEILALLKEGKSPEEILKEYNPK